MTETVFRKILNTVGTLPVEQGGLLGSSDKGQTISHYHFDECAAVTASEYSPNVDVLNRYVLPDWKARGIEAVGFVHSHPRGVTRPSNGDETYAAAILTSNDRDWLALPIVQSAADGPFEIFGYYAERQGNKARIVKAPIKIVPDGFNALADPPAAHSRVEGATPLKTMRRKTIVVIGCGGAGEYIENIARTGVGRIVVMDGDIYSETNLATQQCYRDEMGRNKAEATACRIARIDPEIQVKAVPQFLDNDMTDEEFEYLVGPALFEHPTDVLIAACTDDFFAQARASLLAHKYGTPYLAAQLYEKGQAAEVLFTYPGVTPACPRCTLGPRYQAYLREGYENQVGSQGCPIFATQRVNALKGFVSLMLLLYKEKSTPFAGLLDEVADRNFLQIRMSPDPASLVYPWFHAHLGDSPYTFFDETLWLGVTPEADCPDCHGCGDLSLLQGTVMDSRDIPLGGECE
jgi:proteasome lid subunit RPN8/RPN11